MSPSQRFHSVLKFTKPLNIKEKRERKPASVFSLNKCTFVKEANTFMLRNGSEHKKRFNIDFYDRLVNKYLKNVK